MQYRRFGRTELRMPVFSCGGMRYQQSWSDLPLADVEAENQRNLEATIRRALELGINHIETARGYGSSERQLGVLLPTFPRDELLVQTKIQPEADPGVFRANFLESLDRLRLSHVELLAIHGINTYEHLWQSVRPGGCLQVARELQREGLARHIGFSTHGSPGLVLDAVRVDAHGGFDYVNLHWYFIYQRNWPAVLAANERDMGVFIISPADKGGRLYDPPARLTELCQPLHPLVFNCVFCLARPEVHTLSLGAARPSDFDLQMTSLPLIERASELLPAIESRLAHRMVEVMGQRYVDHWLDGLPDWEDAPGYMNLAMVLWLRSLVLAYDMHDYGQMRYNLLGNGGHWFSGLGAKHTDDFDTERWGKVLADSPFAREIPGWLSHAHELLASTEVKRLSQS